ncbi:MAG: TolC family protein [Candidatus Cloacimonetes bacterium]|nr:TolC family protein [Candidatus Cloacimonadota bacterium]
MKKFLFISLCLTFFMTSLYALQIELSLEAAVDSALVNNQKIKQQEEVVRQKEYLNRAAIGNFLPSLDLFAGYTYLSDNPLFDTEKIKESIDDMFGDYGAVMARQLGLSPGTQQEIHDIIVSGLGTLPAYKLEIDQQQYKNANLVLTQPIFLGGEIWAGKKFAQAQLDFANETLYKTRNEIIQNTTQQYLSVILLQRVVALRKNALSGIKKHEDQAERAIETGIIAPPEIIRAQVAVANAERNLQDAQNELALAKSAFRATLSLPAYTALHLTDSLYFHDMQLDLTETKELALAQNSILREIDHKQKMADQAFAVKRAKFLPQIVAMGEYNLIREDYPIILPRYSLGVQLELNLFHGMKKVNELKSAKHLIREVQVAKKYAEDEIMLLAEDLFYKTENNKTRFLKLKPTVELAKKNLEINETRFREGLGKSIDVIDAQLLYQAASIERLLSLYDYYSSLTQLFLVIGEPQKIISLFEE